MWRCLAHILNLAVQSMLDSLNSGVDIGEDDDGNGPVAIIPKLLKLVVMVRSSPQRREKFAAQCNIAKLKSKELLLDVKTRLNSTYAMISRALELSGVSKKSKILQILVKILFYFCNFYCIFINDTATRCYNCRRKGDA
jgi:hypothetical protein